MQMREKVGKSRNTVFFQWFVAPEGRKVGSLKRRVRSQLARWEMKNCTLLWREAHFQVRSVKNWRVQSTFGSWDVEKVHAVVARSTFRSQKCRKLRGTEHCWTFRCRFAWQAQGIVHLVKVSKTCGFCSISKNDGRRGTLEEDLQRCIFRGRRSTRDMFIRDVRRWGHWFSERGWVLEHQIWQALYFRQVEWKNRKTHWYEAVSSALNLPFLKEVSQNCFVFDVVKFRTWGTLAELLRFGCCQVQALRKSRRVASFWALSS